MNHTVVWLASAEQDLVAQYLIARQHDEARLVAPAVTRIDQALQRNPQSFGESRADNQRIGFEPPLTVEYEVFPDNRLVVVTRVRYRRPNPR